MTPYVFHVHTYRCKHASREADDVYIERAISLGAASITFTDHAPFPGDPFGNRMDYCELPEYLQTLANLKDKYAGKIEVKIGLEIEYLPSFKSYYEDLLAQQELELLMLGQHIHEISPGIWNFMASEEDREGEYCRILESSLEGLETGYFKVMAHPDRSFRKMKTWTPEMQEKAEFLVFHARKRGVVLEKNYSSMCKKQEYWEEFWRCVPETMDIVFGSDAHSPQDIKCYCGKN